MKKKFLLVTPPDVGKFFFYRGVMELGSFLNREGYPTEILPLAYYLDCPSPGSDVKERAARRKKMASILKEVIKRVNPIAVGVSAPFTRYYSGCLDVMKICKNINEKLVTIIGGRHVTFMDMDTLGQSSVDVVVRGEGEWTTSELLSAIESKKGLENVQGITFKKAGAIVRTPDRPPGDLAKLPPVDFGMLPLDLIRRSEIHGMLNRGCIYGCKFCCDGAFWKNTRRSFAVQRLIYEMKNLQRKYSASMSSLSDTMLHIGSPPFFELCSELIKNKVRLHPDFFIRSRVDTITDKGAGAMKKAGMKSVFFGVESASPKVLKKMNKHTSIGQVIAACSKLRKHDIRTVGFWIIGHPGDNPKEAAYSLEMLKHLYSEGLLNASEIHIFVPYPGTPFFEEPQKYGIEMLTLDWDRWQMGGDKPVYQLKEFSAKDISSFYRKNMDVANRYIGIENILSRFGKSR